MRTALTVALCFGLLALGMLVATGQIDRTPGCSSITYHGRCL